MPHIAKIVFLGDEQIVHLPAGYFSDGDELEISRDGDAVVLRRLAGLEDERRAKPRTSIAEDLSDDLTAGAAREQRPLSPDDPGKILD